jgi:hypothetical protein
LYDTSALTYQSWTNVAGFPGLSVNATLPGTIVIGGFTGQTGGFSIPDHSVFFSLTFVYSGGISGLTWYDNGSSCEYTGPAPTYTVLNDLPFDQYYLSGSVDSLLSVGFSAGNLLPATDETVTFLDETGGSPSAWFWSFSPSTIHFVNGTDDGSQNPQVRFTENGVYSVALTVSKDGCSVTGTKTDYIHAGTPGLWTGEVSSDWYDEENWHNRMIPDAYSSVVIPSEAPNWPVYEGDFTIGIQCLHLTIQGPTGQMTVTGDFKILP